MKNVFLVSYYFKSYYFERSIQNTWLLIMRSNQYFLWILFFDPIENCVSIKCLSYWSPETSSVTIKRQIESYFLFYFLRWRGLPERERPLSLVADVVLRGFGEPSQFRGAICSFAFLRRNVRHSVVHFAHRARFCLHRAGCSPAPYAYNVHRAATRNRNEEMQIYHIRPRSDYLPSNKRE